LLTFQATQSYAQEPTKPESAATPTASHTPSNDEIKRTLVRAIDTVNAQKEQVSSLKEVITQQDLALRDAQKAAELYKKASELNAESANKYKTGMESATEAWKREEKRTRDLEKKLRGQQTKTRFAVVAGVAAAVTIFLLK
jgi:hypothetical protein